MSQAQGRKTQPTVQGRALASGPFSVRAQGVEGVEGGYERKEGGAKGGCGRKKEGGVEGRCERKEAGSTHMNLQLPVNPKRRVLQRLRHAHITILEVSVLAHQGDVHGVEEAFLAVGV